MPFDTRRLATEADGRVTPQYFNVRNDRYEVAQGDVGALNISSTTSKFRDDFAGTTLSANWSILEQGAGHTISVTGSALNIATGTTINTTTIIRCLRSFTIPFRTNFTFLISQRIANQEFFLEVTNAAGDMLAQWLFSGTSNLVGTHNTINSDTSGAPASPAILITSAFSIVEIEAFPDEMYFHNRAVDSVDARGVSAVRTRLIPDPNEEYFMQICVRNLGVAPASTTTLTVDAVTMQDITELTAEVTAGRGSIVGSQAIATQIVGGALGIQSINVPIADTTATLAANAVFNGIARNFTVVQRTNRFRAASMSDQAGTLFVEQSIDGTTWVMTHSATTTSVTDADAVARHIARIDAEIYSQQARVRYRNGATIQGLFRLVTMQVSV